MITYIYRCLEGSTIRLFYHTTGKQGFGSQVSMSTYNSQYMYNHNFQPPAMLRGVETVINPLADPETISHDYHEPSEMNAARALPHLPVSTVTNVHYGSQMLIGRPESLPDMASGDPHYQDPDELESVSLCC